MYWANSWQNLQNAMCAQQTLRSAWASTQSDQSLLCAKWVAKDPGFLHVGSKDSDQTGQMPSLIWVFAGCSCYLVGFVMSWLILYILNFLLIYYTCMSRNVLKHTFEHSRPAKIQFILRIHEVWSESSLGTLQTMKILIRLCWYTGWLECLLGTPIERYVLSILAHCFNHYLAVCLSYQMGIVIATNKALFFIRKMLISFLFLNKIICCGYSLEAPLRGASNEYPQHMFLSRNTKNIM